MVSKVSGVGGPRGASAPQKTKKASSGGDFVGNLQPAQGPGDAAPAESLGGVASVSAVLAAQATDDPTEGRAKGLLLARGEGLLDRLDDIRMGILQGSVEKEKLVSLAQQLREKRVTVDDQNLEALIDEIELRAEVELAKLTRPLPRK